MIRLLIKIFVKDKENIKDKKVRENYGVLGGVLGIFCNFFLCALKVSIGIIVSSMAIMSDGFNNLSDCGSSIVSVFSAKLSNKKPDKEHPFGHGRLEYIASLIVSFIIIFMGLQLFMTSTEKLINNDISNEFNPILIGILLISVLVKLWMYYYNNYIGKKIDSMVLKASATDSIGDAIITLVIIISTVVGHYLLPNFPLDSIMGILVSALIIVSGVKLTISTSDTLLGNKPSKELIDEISTYLKKDSRILGIHDLLVHDYGPGRKIASVHAEVSDKSDVVEIHELIDKIEKDVENEVGVLLVVHMDPISVDDPEVLKIRTYLDEMLLIYNKKITYHDLRITKGNENINVIFDIVIPFEMNKEETKEVINYLKDKITNLDIRYSCVINIDYE